MNATARNAGIHVRVDSNLPQVERDWVVGFVSFLREYYPFSHPLRIRIYGTERIMWDNDDWAQLAFYPKHGETSSVDVRIAAGRWNSLSGDDLIDERWNVLLGVAHQVKHYFQWQKGLKHRCDTALEWGDRALTAYLTDSDPPPPWRGARLQ